MEARVGVRTLQVLYIALFLLPTIRAEITSQLKVRGPAGSDCLAHRVYTEWQPPLSGVHSIMMEKLAQVCGYGVCTPTPFHYSYHHVQS